MINLGELISQERDNLKLIDEGTHGAVYKIGDSGYCLKVIGDGTYWTFNFNTPTKRYDRLERICEIVKIAYDNGVCVPKPEGVLGVKDPKTGKFLPGFVMEYIVPSKGPWIIKKARIGKGWAREMEKAEKAGVVVRDSKPNGHNCIWNPKRRRTCLIDFDLWRKAK